MPVQKWSDSIWVVNLAGDPGFTEDVDSLVRQMEDGRVPDLVLDFAGVDHINSMNLSQLLRLRKRMIDADARLRLAAPPDPVWALFLTTGLDKVFQFAPDTPTALAKLQIEPRIGGS